ncbi:MAG: ATP synthase F1 subunit gamma [Eubacteriaceae bacterium]|jgi:F-type H+-transporting ATPase subunit gamma|nr:ATP synthase F1 subunit gamma [Eubacteriaceae bacterium]
MASSDLQAVKRRIRSVTSMEHITNAMKLVSAAKLRRAKTSFEKSNQYLHFITDSIAEIFNNTGEVPEKYLEGGREIHNTCYIVITSSRGLCGSFNSNIIKIAEEEMAKDENPLLFTIGTRGRDHFAKRGYTICQDVATPPENFTFLDSQELSSPIIEMYDKGEIDKVVLVYTSYLSQLEQAATKVQLLPFSADLDPEVMKQNKEVEYEPSVGDVFNYLVPKYMETMLYGAIIESATCEHAARRMAMENATDNAREMLGDLSLYYNRARQAAITNELIEVVSGSEALS